MGKKFYFKFHSKAGDRPAAPGHWFNLKSRSTLERRPARIELSPAVSKNYKLHGVITKFIPPALRRGDYRARCTVRHAAAVDGGKPDRRR